MSEIDYEKLYKKMALSDIAVPGRRRDVGHSRRLYRILPR